MNANSFEEIVRTNLRRVEDSPDFTADEIWLSFDLWGSPADLKRLSEELHTRGWTEIDRENCWNGGFLYPRRLVDKSFEAIRETSDALEQLCRLHGAEIELMDAINGPPGPNTTCIVLYYWP